MVATAEQILRDARAYRSRVPHLFGQDLTRGAWHPYPYLRLISATIRDAVAAGRGRIIITAPPRHGKSYFLSRVVPTWFLNRYPERFAMAASYGTDLADKNGRWVRNQFADNEYCYLNGETQLSVDSTAAGDWHLKAGGGMFSTGIMGPATGRGYHLGIIDDTIKNWKEANSSAYRNDVIDWYQSVFYTRAEPDATIVVLMTRWHPNDLIGHLLSDEDGDTWTTINLPAIAEAGDIMGRKPGEALCPERYDLPALKSIQRAVGELKWQALYQQDPQGVSAGRVYKKFTVVRNVDKAVELRHDLPLDMAWDFNLNPGMHVIVGQYDPRADLFTAVHELHGPRWDVEQTMEAFERLMEQLGGPAGREIHVYGDVSGNTPSMVSSESCYQRIFMHLQRKKWVFRRRVPRSAPGIRDSVDAFNEALYDIDGRVRYRVNPRCTRLIDDLSNLVTDDKGMIDKTDQTLSHASDAERYRVALVRPLVAKPSTTRSRFSVRVEG